MLTGAQLYHDWNDKIVKAVQTEGSVRLPAA